LKEYQRDIEAYRSPCI